MPCFYKGQLDSHPHLTSEPRFRPSPVFSVYQTDVPVYGDDLLDYVAREFNAPPFNPGARMRVPFWSDLAEGAEDCDL